MNYSFHPEAETEFNEAIRFYDNCQTGLGLDFANEVRSAIQQIVNHPFAWPVLEGEVRRCLIFRFPYGILYYPEPNHVLLLAVMHLHRDPDYWKHRS